MCVLSSVLDQTQILGKRVSEETSKLLQAIPLPQETDLMTELFRYRRQVLMQEAAPAISLASQLRRGETANQQCCQQPHKFNKTNIKPRF
jgi:hypothetical protein